MNVKREMEQVINKVSIPLTDREELAEYLEHDEWGVAFEHFCATILDEHIQISESMFNELKQIGAYMELEEQTWEQLKKLIHN